MTMRSIVKKNILKIKPYVPGKPIEEVQRELGLKDVAKLASNENPFGPSPKVLKAINAVAKNINRYPESSCFYLRRELVKRLGVREDQLIFGNGSDEIIILATRAFSGPGDEVIAVRPSFLIYAIAAKASGAKLKFVPLKELKYDLGAMKRAVTKKTKIIFIGNPDNPSGAYITKRQLGRFLKSIRRNILVFLDEAYFEFVDKKDYPDSIKFLKTYKNLIVTRTFSKMYGLAGLRVGYGIASPEIVDLLSRIKEPFNVNSVAQAAAVACLKDATYYRWLIKKIKKQRSYLCTNFKKLGLNFVATATNFILVDVKGDSFQVWKKLLKEGIIVRDMGVWGLDTYIRITIGTEKENKKIIKALRKIL